VESAQANRNATRTLLIYRNNVTHTILEHVLLMLFAHARVPTHLFMSVVKMFQDSFDTFIDFAKSTNSVSWKRMLPLS